jgi:16S rRNA (uracil1498-N3)-methyltransferase
MTRGCAARWRIALSFARLTMRRRFFVDQFDRDSAMLRGDAATHLTRVLRAEAGQQFELSDGTQLWLGEISQVERGSVKFSLIEQLQAQPARLHVDLLLAIVKFDRFEWAIEKATELGVSAIVPVAAARSEKGLIAAAAKRAARWQKILFESAQQSRRMGAPKLAGVVKSEAGFNGGGRADAIRILLSEEAAAPSLKDVLSEYSTYRLSDCAESTARISIAIGPEGGWTSGELELAKVAGFRAASLGAYILRTETAVAAALASINYALGG